MTSKVYEPTFDSMGRKFFCFSSRLSSSRAAYLGFREDPIVASAS